MKNHVFIFYNKLTCDNNKITAFIIRGHEFNFGFTVLSNFCYDK